MRTTIDFFRIRLPRRRFEISTGIRTEADLFVVRAESGGVIGWGAGTPSIAFSDSPEKCEAALAISGKSPIDFHQYFERDFSLDMRNRSIAATAALDIAMWDLRGKIEGKSLSRLLGSHPRSFQTSATIDIGPIDDSLDQARRYLEEGFKILKIKVGKSMREDIERVREIEKIASPNARLFVDANGGYASEDAIEFWTEISDQNLEIFEQPLPPDQLAGMATLRREHGMRICADESAVDECSLDALIDAEAADMINIKLMKCGGVRPALDMIHIARDNGIDVIFGCMGDIGLSIGAAAHIACVANPSFVDLDSHLNIERICDGPPVREGVISIDENPGIGVNLLENWKKWQVR